MDRYDPTAAFFSAFSSIWGRILLFFLTAFLGHGAGYLAAFTLEGEPFEIDAQLSDLAFLPIGFLWQVLQNFFFPWGMGYVVVLGILFFLICFTECRLIFPVALLFVLQVWDTFFLQRHLAVHAFSFFSGPPDFSPWGYAFAGGFTALVIALLLGLAIASYLQARQVE